MTLYPLQGQACGPRGMGPSAESEGRQRGREPREQATRQEQQSTQQPQPVILGRTSEQPSARGISERHRGRSREGGVNVHARTSSIHARFPSFPATLYLGTCTFWEFNDKTFPISYRENTLKRERERKRERDNNPMHWGQWETQTSLFGRS
uniref:Uncharacterized protein n=1 Tax=Mustela putorius furo TaxID=9669 RepID=M3YEU3_MUSPF